MEVNMEGVVVKGLEEEEEACQVVTGEMVEERD